jgi:hypothetical protein
MKTGSPSENGIPASIHFINLFRRIPQTAADAYVRIGGSNSLAVIGYVYNFI